MFSEADLKKVLENTEVAADEAKAGVAANLVSMKKVLGLDEHFHFDVFCHALKRLTGGVPRAVSFALLMMKKEHLPTI